MSIPSAEQKRLVRQRTKALGREKSPELRLAESKSICEAVAALPEWGRAGSILGFFPLADEPNVRALLEVALSSGKRLRLPRFSAVKAQYEAVEVGDLNRDLVTGRYGVLEPSEGCQAVSTMHLDFALVPGVAFDIVCGRLGRGGGYYDRLLAGSNVFKCGVAFTWQLAEVSIPVEPHDVCMDCVVTPTACYLKRARAPEME